MNFSEKLKAIHHYYMANRNVGHTNLMKIGTNNYDKPKIILCVDFKHVKNIGIKKTEAVTLNSLNNLVGNNKPLVLDNFTVIRLIENMEHAIHSMEDQVELAIREKYEETKKRVAAEYTINEMKSHPFKTFFKTIFKQH